MKSKLAHWQAKLSTFWYNFCWPDYTWLLDSRLAKASIGIPFVGYLIIFNDTIAYHLNFTMLAGDNQGWWLVTSDARLRLVYFGLIALAIANIWYFLRRPPIMRIGSDEISFSNKMFEIATLFDYIHYKDQIDARGHRTLQGKIRDDAWDNFKALAGASNRSGGKDDYNLAKSKHESMLRGILRETYFRETTGRRKSLIACIAIGSLGIGLLAIPSVDLFARVFWVCFFKETMPTPNI